MLPLTVAINPKLRLNAHGISMSGPWQTASNVQAERILLQQAVQISVMFNYDSHGFAVEHDLTSLCEVNHIRMS